jgi:two-component system chemotaxis response regulator CheB
MNPRKLLVIGASAGGLKAMRTILSQLSRPLPWPALLVQHVPASAKMNYLAVFGASPFVQVVEAEANMPLEQGFLYVAPPGYHTLIEENGSISLSLDPPVQFSRPSIDVTFETAAEVYGAQTIALVLTGANEDGAAGLQAIHAQGAVTIVQDPATAEATAMPRGALKRVPGAHVVKLDDIAGFLEGLAEEKG